MIRLWFWGYWTSDGPAPPRAQGLNMISQTTTPRWSNWRKRWNS